MNAKNVLNFAADQGARFVSIRFTDLPGAWHHLTYPIEMLTEAALKKVSVSTHRVCVAGR